MPDTTAPTFVSAATSSDGAQITLTYSESLLVRTALETDFIVSVDGSAAPVTQVAAINNNVVLGLGLPTPILPGQAVSIRYTAPTNDTATTNRAIQDQAGNDAPPTVRKTLLQGGKARALEATF
jgi:uncharacterized repeat protein (TIGR02059 family)